MKNKLIVIFAIGFVSCGKMPNTSRAPLSGYVYQYGSSISVGFYGTSNYGSFIADRLNRNFVQKAHGGTSLLDRNAQGDLSQSETITPDIGTWDPDGVILWDTGINDAIVHGEDAVYQASYNTELRRLLQAFHDNKMKAYISTPNHNCNEMRFGTNAIEDEYGAITKQAVSDLADPKIQLVDYSIGFVPVVNNTRDCIHPNFQGYLQMTDYFFAQFPEAQ